MGVYISDIKVKIMNEKKVNLTYIFLRRAIVELIGLDTDVGTFLHLDLEHGRVNDGFVHLVLLVVAVEGSGTLG